MRGDSTTFRTRRASFRRSELGGLITDTAYVAVWHGAGALGDLLQIALIAHVLGLEEYGRLALIIASVTLIGEFFAARSPVASITLAARHLGVRNEMVAGIFQRSFLIEAGGAAVALVVLLGSAPLFGPGLVGSNSIELISIFGLSQVGTALERPPLALLRLLDRFRLIAVYAVSVEVLRVGALIVVLTQFDSLVPVVIALALTKIFAAVSVTVLAMRAFKGATDLRLTTSMVHAVSNRERRHMWHTVAHTNVFSYARLAQTQLPTLLLGGLSGPVQTGVYKIGIAAAAIIGRIVDTAHSAMLPRLSRLWASGESVQFRRLIRTATFLSVPALVTILALLLVFSDTVLIALGGEQAGDEAGPVLVFGAIAQALYALTFWRMAVLYATHHAAAVAWSAVAGAAAQIVLLLALAPSSGARGAAVAFLAGSAVMTLLMTRAAARAMRTPPADVAGKGATDEVSG